MRSIRHLGLLIIRRAGPVAKKKMFWKLSNESHIWMTWELATSSVDIESHIPRLAHFTKTWWAHSEAKAPSRLLSAHSQKLLNRENQLKIFVNLFFSSLSLRWLMGLFLKCATKTTSEQHIFNSRKDGFVLMSGNEIVINYSKVKFVWTVFLIFNLVLFISKTKS